jgi:hypothetical protein
MKQAHLRGNTKEAGLFIGRDEKKRDEKVLAPRRRLVPLRIPISYLGNLKAALKNCEQNVKAV